MNIHVLFENKNVTQVYMEKHRLQEFIGIQKNFISLHISSSLSHCPYLSLSLTRIHCHHIPLPSQPNLTNEIIDNFLIR